MKKDLIFWLMALALGVVPALQVSAQEGPGPDDEPGFSDEGPEGPGEPGMGPRGPMGPGGKMGPGMRQGGMEDEQIMIKKRKMMMKKQGFGGPVFLDEDEVLAVIKKHDPEFAKKVTELREAAPAKYKMLVQMSGKLFGAARMENDEALEKDAVRALSLEFDSKELSLKYDKASDADKKAIKEKLRGVLSELFDLKTKAQELRVKRMEKEIAKLKKNLDSRKANKAKIVEQRLEQMTGEGYGW
jgi:hypothetical protein